MINTLVYYHSNCPDGFGSAWAFSKFYSDKAEYIPFTYGNKIKDYEGKNVFFLDCSCDREYLLEIKSKAKSLVLIDHHITALNNLGDLDFCKIDMDNSGCVLSWKYLYSEKETPIILRYIEDRDLWKWNMKHSKEILCYVDSFDRTFSNWDHINNLLSSGEESFNTVIKSGSDILRYKSQLAEKISKNSERIKICGYNGIMVNSPFLQGEIADELTSYDVVLVYYRVGSMYKCSLRTTKDNVNVAKIAEKFGGGGHRKASGFVTSNLEKVIR